MSSVGGLPLQEVGHDEEADDDPKNGHPGEAFL